MPNLVSNRIDELPLDRRIAGEARGMRRDTTLNAIYERRDIDPTASHVKRRHGSRRVTSSQPNLVGLTAPNASAHLRVDYDFSNEVLTNLAWTMFGTVQVPGDALVSDCRQRIVAFNGVEVYVQYTLSTNQFRFVVYNSAGTQLLLQSAAYNLTQDWGLRFALVRTLTDVKLNVWEIGGNIAADLTSTFTLPNTNVELVLFGSGAVTSSHIPNIVLNNVMLFDDSTFATATYEASAGTLTPVSTQGATLFWHHTFADGGNVLTYNNSINSYLVPTTPSEDGTSVLFGGKGVIEIPFYLDFDEYFWTSSNASARLSWCFQFKITLPAILGPSVIYELQDLIRLEVVLDGANYKLQASFSDTGAVVLSTVVLTGGSSHDVFVARDPALVYLKVGSVEVNAAAPNPVIYEYDKTIGIVIGDRADQSQSSPFGGKLTRLALHNESARTFHPKLDAVFYYDADSVQGDEFIDRGNRSLNGYGGTRASYRPPFYAEGAFVGGSYVAATGGYTINSVGPGVGYTGQLVKALLKDVVVQRRGDRAFMTSDGVSYLIDNIAKTFRPLGVPRPSTKVSCSPQGVGAIDGFVRYAYRFITVDGTVGPIFELDPCDATGGVNVFLGADTFGSATDPVFGLSYGECEAPKPAGNTVESFLVRDRDANNNQLLHDERELTLELAFRIPSFTQRTDESIISQGASFAGTGATGWASINDPKTFPEIGQRSQESTMQFTFRYNGGTSNQSLFTIGSRNQRYHTGSVRRRTHWRCHILAVSIQQVGLNNQMGIVVCRQDGGRDDALHHFSQPYNWVDGHDYSVFVSRCGSSEGRQRGSDLRIMIYDHTLDRWDLWPSMPSGTTQITNINFFGPTFTHPNFADVMWGCCRDEGQLTGRTRVYDSSTNSFEFFNLPPFRCGTANNPQIMYHGRMWTRDIQPGLLRARALDRYAAESGPLSRECAIDVAFCSDSSKETLSGGFDRINDIRTTFKAEPSAVDVDADVYVSPTTEQTVLLAYGNSSTVASTDQIPVWASYSTRNGGSLVIGTGRIPCFELAQKKWHAGSEVRTFDEFANVIDLTEWTWITLHLEQILRGSTLDVWLRRIFLDGNTGEWGDLFSADTAPGGPAGKKINAAAGDGQHLLFTVGSPRNIQTYHTAEFAEVRLWQGEYYTAQGGGSGPNAFGAYLSSRIPPNKYDELWHYLRFAPVDVNDMNAQTTMDQFGTYADPGGTSQKTADAVTIYQGAEVTLAEVSGSGGARVFVPFPAPPIEAIRGIEIFRSQVVPVEENYPTGEPNPNALRDAFKAARAAPLYYLTEIPDGTDFYLDTATDALLGVQLDQTAGLIPKNAGGVVEWLNYIGIWVKDRPRIYFAASPKSWESYPTDYIYDLPVRESGPIEAAAELAARDDRNARLLVLGRSWGAFLDGNPINPETNTLGGGVGAWTARCLVVEQGVAYAYNGTLWAITGDGQVADIGLPVLDLLPPPESTRLAVSASLGSLFVINEITGLTLRWHFARREWFVEDRYALSTTDIDGVDQWVHVSGYLSSGAKDVYADDVELTTPTSLAVSSVSHAANSITVSSTTGISVGQRITVVADQDPRVRVTVTVRLIVGNTISFNEDINATNLPLSGTTPNATPGGSTAVNYTFTAYPGIGYWGTMLDTGQFTNAGVIQHVDVGVVAGSRWFGMLAGADFAGDPASRSAFDSPESHPTRFDDGAGVGRSARWGLGASQRIQRILVWNPEPQATGLSELEMNYAIE